MKKVLLVILVFFTFLNVNAQLSERGYPQSFVYANIKSQEDVALSLMPSFDLEKIEKEDKVTDLDKSIPYRFGFAFDVDLGFENGTIEETSSGTQIWRLRIKSEGAQTINIKFNKFKLAKGARLFIYSKDKQNVIGAFTSKNNKSNGRFSTGLVRGEEIVIELNEPSFVVAQTELEISSVIHGYRSLKGTQSFGTSGSCNNNVVCPEGDLWRDDIRSSAMILLGNGTRWCSGSFINNVRNDALPYFLTAYHCIDNFGTLEDVSDWIYMFNYNSPDCLGSIDGDLTQTLQGSSIVSYFEPSDFALLLLDTIPPLHYNTYYSGWSAKDTISDSVVSIHHPDGDVKKISFDYDTIEHSGYFGNGTNHWQVLGWDDGTTEPGSSGAPLFDKNHRIIGQLHGGDAKCGNNDEDYYGKLSYSWNTGDTSLARLKDWLDPDSTDTWFLNGRDYNSPIDSVDASIIELQIPSEICGDSFTPKFILHNFGADTLFKIKFYFELDNQTDSVLWNGSLVFGKRESVILPTLPVGSGNHIFKVYSSLPNDSIDGMMLNDTLLKVFNVENGVEARFNMNADWAGYESRVVFKNDTNGLLYFRSSFPSDMTTTKDFCLVDNCYELLITDNNENGICCGFGEGSYEMIINEDTVFQGGVFEDSARESFCLEVGKYLNVEDKLISKTKIYPNPTTGIVNLSFNKNVRNATLEVFNSLGMLVLQKSLSSNSEMVDLSKMENGIYMVIVKEESKFERKTLVLIK